MKGVNERAAELLAQNMVDTGPVIADRTHPHRHLAAELINAAREFVAACDHIRHTVKDSRAELDDIETAALGLDMLHVADTPLDLARLPKQLAVAGMAEANLRRRLRQWAARDTTARPPVGEDVPPPEAIAYAEDNRDRLWTGRGAGEWRCLTDTTGQARPLPWAALWRECGPLVPLGPLGAGQ